MTVKVVIGSSNDATTLRFHESGIVGLVELIKENSRHTHWYKTKEEEMTYLILRKNYDSAIKHYHKNDRIEYQHNSSIFIVSLMIEEVDFA